MSKTQLFSKLVDEREKCRVERLKNRQNEIILEQVRGMLHCLARSKEQSARSTR